MTTLSSDRTLTSGVPSGPEEEQVFRLAQLLLLLEQVAESTRTVATIDRIGYYDFFAANPYIVLGGNAKRDPIDRRELKLAGFLEDQLSYASTGERYVSRRRRLRDDMSLLLGYGLVTIRPAGYVLSEQGKELAASLVSVYADGYRKSVQVILRRVGSLSDSRLLVFAQSVLGRSWLLLDIIGGGQELATESINIDQDV